MATQKMLKLISSVLFSTIILLQFKGSASQDLIIGQPIPSGNNVVFNCTDRLGAYCSTCHSITTCVGEDTSLTTTCTGVNRYCLQSELDEAICVADPNANAECESSAIFICTDIGFFPNPMDCTKFFHCQAPSVKPQEYSCVAPGWVYTGSSVICTRQKHSKDCALIDCSKTPGSTTGYAADPTIYAICGGIKSDGSQDMFVRRCKYGEVYVPANKGCNFQCPSEGYFVNGRNCLNYYQCYKIGVSYEYINHNCPQGTYFDKELKQCVIGTC